MSINVCACECESWCGGTLRQTARHPPTLRSCVCPFPAHFPPPAPSLFFASLPRCRFVFVSAVVSEKTFTLEIPFFFLRIFLALTFKSLRLPKNMSSWMQAGLQGRRTPLSTLNNENGNLNSSYKSVECHWPTARQDIVGAPLRHRPSNTDIEVGDFRQTTTDESPSIFFGTQPFSGFNLKHDTETLKRKSQKRAKRC